MTSLSSNNKTEKQYNTSKLNKAGLNFKLIFEMGTPAALHILATWDVLHIYDMGCIYMIYFLFSYRL